jgi:glycosyltransferase involved in cell wall biosynthesis
MNEANLTGQSNIKASSHSTKPKVLKVVISTPENREGAVRAGLLLGEYLKSYVDIDVVKMAGNYDDALADELETEFCTIETRTWMRDVCNLFFGSSKNYANTVMWCNFEPPLPISEYDIIHIHNSVPLLAMIQIAVTARAQGIPYCVTTHGISKVPELPDQMGMSWPIKQAFKFGYLRPYYWVLKNATHLFALSNQDAELMYELFPDQSVSVTPNGVKRAGDPKSPAPKESGITVPETYMLFVGKIRESKGVSDLLEAYRAIETDIELLIAGPEQNHVLVEELKGTDGVNYLGYVEKETLDELYMQTDLFVFPTRSDVFPLVTLEAMAAGTPIISTKVGGLPEQISDDVGILVPPESPQQLADALSELLTHPERLAELGEHSIQRVQNEFSWDSIATDVADKYTELMANN